MRNKKYLILLSVFVLLLMTGCIKQKETKEKNPYSRTYVCSLEKGNSVSYVDFNLDEEGKTDSVYIRFEGNVDDIVKKDERTENVKDDITEKIHHISDKFSLSTAGERIALELDVNTKGMKEIILYVFGENPTGFHEDKMNVAKLKEVFTNAGYKCK